MTGCGRCVFSAKKGIRATLIEIITHKNFEYFISVVIVLNCITMALEPPPDINKLVNHTEVVWEILEQIFMIIYSLEMLMKIGAFGFIL